MRSQAESLLGVEVGKAYKNNKGQWELLLHVIDLRHCGFGLAPSVTDTGKDGKLFESKEEAEEHFKDLPEFQQFNKSKPDNNG